MLLCSPISSWTSVYIYPPPTSLAKVVKERSRQQQEYIHPSIHQAYLSLEVHSFPGTRNFASMGRSSGAPVLPAHHEDEDEDEDLFETSSSISGDSDDEAQFSDGEDAEAQEHQLEHPVRRLNSDCLSDLSSMKAQLPIKKGLSKCYDGKSQSFACMSEVRCLDDLRKKENPYKNIKSCKSYVDLDGNQKACHAPGLNSKAAKKPSGSSCANLMARSNSKNMLYMPPPIPVNKSGFHQ